ncbi:MAG: GH25 family lysozyme, partial [Myxococcaceae bacterium]
DDEGAVGAPRRQCLKSRTSCLEVPCGIAVSRHNGAIDWSAVAGGGLHFAWVKASEGGDVRDARFKMNSSGAEAAGVRSGPYHFFTFCRPGSEQAENFLSAIAGTRQSLPIAVDVEFVGKRAARPAPDSRAAERVDREGRARDWLTCRRVLDA